MNLKDQLFQFGEIEMGYSFIEHRFGRIESFEPDNDENTLYIPGTFSNNLEYLIERIKDYFGTKDLLNYSIEAEYIHTNCLGYDQHVPSDYTNYIVIRNLK